MDKELARHIVRTTFKSSAGLEDLLPLLRHHCAGAIADIHRELTTRVFSTFPELQAEVDRSIQKYGRIL